MNAPEARRLLEEASEGWFADPESDVIWVGDYEGRRGVRLRLSEGEPATVWFKVGERTVAVEAFILPSPPAERREEVYRQCLARNTSFRRLHLALDRRGDVVLIGRVPLREVDEAELELLLGEMHEGLAIARPALARAAFEREKMR